MNEQQLRQLDDSDPVIQAVRSQFDLGAMVWAKVNSGRGWTAVAQRKLERAIGKNLAVILGRIPTPEEINLAGAQE